MWVNPELQEGFATLLYKQVHYAKINQSTGQNSTQRLTYNSQKRNCRLRGNGMRPELREYPALRSTKSSQKHNCQPQKGNWVTPEQREAFRRTLNNTPAGYGAASQNLGGATQTSRNIRNQHTTCNTNVSTKLSSKEKRDRHRLRKQLQKNKKKEHRVENRSLLKNPYSKYGSALRKFAGTKNLANLADPTPPLQPFSGISLASPALLQQFSGTKSLADPVLVQQFAVNKSLADHALIQQTACTKTLADPVVSPTETTLITSNQIPPSQTPPSESTNEHNFISLTRQKSPISDEIVCLSDTNSSDCEEIRPNHPLLIINSDDEDPPPIPPKIENSDGDNDDSTKNGEIVQPAPISQPQKDDETEEEDDETETEEDDDETEEEDDETEEEDYVTEEETDDDIVFIEPNPPEVVDLDDDTNQSVKGGEMESRPGTPESNDFLETSTNEIPTGSFNFSLHGTDFTSREFLKPSSGEAYETESSSSDASTPIKNQVFPEPAFEPPPPNLNFDLSPKPPQSTQTKLLKLTAATSSSSPKRKQSSESSNSDSSSESDYEDPSIVNVRKIARIDLPDLSVIDSEEDFGSNLEVDGSIGGDPSTIKVGNKRRCLLDLSIPTSDDEVNKSCGDPSIIKVRSKLPDVSGYSPITSDEELNKCIGDPSTINVGNKKHCISDLSLIICEEELDKNLGDPSAIEVGKADRQCVGSFLPITSDDPDETSIGDPSTIKVKKAARQFSPISSNEDFETSPELTNSTKENLTLAVTDIVIENEKKQEGDENKKDCEEKSSTSKAHEIVHEELKCIGKDKATIIGNQILSDATTRIESPEKQTESVNTSTTTTEHQMDNDVLVLDVSDVALLDVNSVVVLDDSDSIVIEVSDTSDEDDNLVGVKDISDNLQVANLIHTSVVQSVPKKSKGGSKRKTFVDYWMDDQQKFYFESWGDENFNTADAQKTMSDDPSLWKIVREDRKRIMGPSTRKGPRCNRCREYGHRVLQCRVKPKSPICVLCAGRDHYESRCPDQLCNLCGRRGPYSTIFCSMCSKIKDVRCRTCSCFGHIHANCPDLWRRYHLTVTRTTPVKPEKIIEKPKKDRWCCHCGRQGHYHYHCQQGYGRTHPIQHTIVSEYTDVYGYSTNGGHRMAEKPKPSTSTSNESLPEYISIDPPPPPAIFLNGPALPHPQSNTQTRKSRHTSLAIKTDGTKYDILVSRHFMTYLKGITTQRGITIDLPQSRRNGKLVFHGLAAKNHKTMFQVNQYLKKLVTQHEKQNLPPELKQVKKRKTKSDCVRLKFTIQKKLKKLESTGNSSENVYSTYRQIQKLEAKAVCSKKTLNQLVLLYTRLHTLLFAYYQVGAGKEHMRLLREWMKTEGGQLTEVIRSAYEFVFNNGTKNKFNYPKLLMSLKPSVGNALL